MKVQSTLKVILESIGLMTMKYNLSPKMLKELELKHILEEFMQLLLIQLTKNGKVPQIQIGREVLVILKKIK